MNDEQRELASDLPSHIADWLHQYYPTEGEATVLLKQVSLGKSDYCRLAKHNLAGSSHASDRACRLFAQRLGLSGQIRVLRETRHREARHANLLAYHLRPLQRHATDEEELREATAFVDGLHKGH